MKGTYPVGIRGVQGEKEAVEPTMAIRQYRLDGLIAFCSGLGQDGGGKVKVSVVSRCRSLNLSFLPLIPPCFVMNDGLINNNRT